MSTTKIFKLLNDSTISKFVKWKWIEVIDLSNGQNSTKKNKKIKNPMLRSNLCDFSDSYILVKDIITVGGTNNANKKIKS